VCFCFKVEGDWYLRWKWLYFCSPGLYHTCVSMTDIYLTISLSTHNEDDTPQNAARLLATAIVICEFCTASVAASAANSVTLQTKHTNIIAVTPPHRHDRPDFSCFNKETQVFNRKLRKLLKNMHHFLLLNSIINPYYHSCVFVTDIYLTIGLFTHNGG